MKCIIVDDEYPARTELKYFLENYKELEIVGEFEDSIPALSFFEKNNVDVIFLDINMPNMNGMTLANILSKFNRKPKIVFITAHAKYAVEAFGVRAFDYILKPYSKEKITGCIESLVESYNKVNMEKEREITRITLWEGEKMFVFPLEKILVFEACDRETKVFLQNKIYFSKQKISCLEKELPKNFFRTHRSYIVNMNKINEIVPWFNSTYNLKIENLDLDIPVSRNNLKEFRKLLKIK